MAEPILFYDGNCALCNNFVHIILRFGTTPSFNFAPLSGKTAQHMLPEAYKNPNFDAIVLWKNEQFYTHHKAVFEIIRAMPMAIKPILLLQYLPNSLLLNLYKWVAKNRFSWKPRLDACPIPPAKFRKQFIFD